MARALLEVDIAGVPAWAWTIIWLAVGFVVGVVATLAAVKCCMSRRSNTYTAPPRSRSLSPSRPHTAASDMRHQRELAKFDALSSSVDGNSAALPSSNRLDGSVHASLSVNHWAGPAGANLSTVAEDPAGTRGYTSLSRSIGGQHTTEGSAGASGHFAPMANSAPLAGTQQQGGHSGRLTTTAAPVVPAAAQSGRSGHTGGVAATGASSSAAHQRSMSAVSGVSSVGPAAEYEEEELDEEWVKLIREVNALLESKGKPPIRTAGERGIVVNSLLVSTCTRNRTECIRNAAVDMLTHRKMAAARA